MRLTAENTHVLEDAGYTYDFDRQIYINRVAKKLFSIAFVQDHAAELEKYIAEDTQGGQWRFLFNSEPSEAVRKELVRVLHLN